jgi:hypothetical protein
MTQTVRLSGDPPAGDELPCRELPVLPVLLDHRVSQSYNRTVYRMDLDKASQIVNEDGGELSFSFSGINLIMYSKLILTSHN